jgi:hypothetical protein
MEETVIFKSKLIKGNNVELTFCKDYVWNYSELPFPVTTYTLTNCKNLNSVDFKSIDYRNDGVIVEIIKENNYTVLKTTDMGNTKVRIVCEKVVKEEREYNREDLIDIIKEINKSRDGEHELLAESIKRLKDLKHFLTRELDITERKITQAEWITEDKKHFLEGERNALQGTIETINKREKEDFQNQVKKWNIEQATDGN